MVRTVENIYDFMRYLVHKQRGVFLKTADAMSNLDMGQLDAFESYFESYGKTQSLHDALRPFRIDDLPFTSDSSGKVTFPSNYIHLLGSPVNSTGDVISFFNEDDFPRALKSQLRPVSSTNQIAKDRKTGFIIYPQAVVTGTYTYLKRPETPVYATIESGRQLIYDSGDSIQLEWSDVYVNNIIARAMAYAGVSMNEQDVYTFAENYKKETQPQ